MVVFAAEAGPPRATPGMIPQRPATAARTESGRSVVLVIVGAREGGTSTRVQMDDYGPEIRDLIRLSGTRHWTRNPFRCPRTGMGNSERRPCRDAVRGAPTAPFRLDPLPEPGSPEPPLSSRHRVD